MSQTTPQDPDALRADIERTRAQLGSTVDALVAKFDVKSQAKQKTADVTASVKNSVADLKASASEVTSGGVQSTRDAVTLDPRRTAIIGASIAATAIAVAVTVILLRRRS